MFFFFFNDTATTEIYTLSLHDALPISADGNVETERTRLSVEAVPSLGDINRDRSEEHTSELQSHLNLVCRLLLEKKKTPRPKPLTSSPITRQPTPTIPHTCTTVTYSTA